MGAISPQLGTPMNQTARRTKSYAAADIIDTDGVKTSFATSTSPVVLTAADFNGAQILAGGRFDLPRSITINRSNNANQFSVAPIVVVGTYGGVVVTESLTPANDDGNDTLRPVSAFDHLTSISIPAQAGTGGSFTIGVDYVAAPRGATFTAVELVASGTCEVQYGEPAGSPTDTLPSITGRAYFPIGPTRARSAVGLILYL